MALSFLPCLSVGGAEAIKPNPSGLCAGFPLSLQPISTDPLLQIYRSTDSYILLIVVYIKGLL